MPHAFFDLDQTLITAQSQSLLLDTLYENRFISALTLWRLRLFFISYKLHLISRSNLDAVYALVAKVFAGVETVPVDKAVRDFVFKIFPTIENAVAVAELKKHLEQGHVIVLTSSAFEPIVKAAAEYFNIQEYRCSKLEIVDGKYTGKLDGLPNYGEEKVRKLNAFDLTDSYGYSDHQSDIPVLEKMTHPYAVSPTKKLLAYALANKWTILE